VQDDLGRTAEADFFQMLYSEASNDNHTGLFTIIHQSKIIRICNINKIICFSLAFIKLNLLQTITDILV
jgi:hypothetical protein